MVICGFLKTVLGMYVIKKRDKNAFFVEFKILKKNM